MATRTKQVANSLNWKAIGRRVRELRGSDTKQEEFARAVGLSQSQLSRIERGESEMSVETLLQISKFSKKSINWILTGEDE